MLDGIDRARPGLVELWLVDGDAYLGKVQLRAVGLAARALALALPHARALGLAQLTALCDADNPAARALVARFGGVLERDLGDGRLRFALPSPA